MADPPLEPLLATEYPPLPLSRQERDIRLLRLRPGRFEDKLHGTLSIATLEETPRYEAISYAWGQCSLQPQPTITLNRFYELPITDNLYSALRRLRHSFWSRTLWVDAVCINQQDLNERSYQVSLMGSIYSSAHRACVWLGDTSDMELRRRFAVHIVPLGFATRRFHKALRWERFPAHRKITAVEDRILAYMLLQVCEAISTALGQPHPLWHTRAWVYPELINARKLVWCFGPFEKKDRPASLADFLLTGDSLGFWPSRSTGTRARSCGRMLKQAVDNAWCDRNSRFRHTTLLQNASNTATMKCTNPRDKVFSLKGITGAQEAQHIESDYNKSVAQVFAEATYAAISASQNFDALFYVDQSPVCYGSYGTTIEDLPSWAINFTNSDMPQPGVMFGRSFQHLISPTAILRSSWQPQLSDGSCSLRLMIRMLDTVSIALFTNLIEDFVEEPGTFVNDLVDFVCSHCVESDTNGGCMASRQCLTTNFPSVDSASDSAETDQCIATRRPIANNTATNGNCDAVRNWFFATSGMRGIHPDATLHGSRSSLKAIHSYLAHRLGHRGSLFATSHCLLGIGHPNAEAGDMVASLDNSRLPILLRHSGDDYKFVGLAHVRSHIRGGFEAFVRYQDSQLQEVTLV